MIRSSFSFIPGVGHKTESMLWAAGVFTWDDLSERKDRLQVGRDKRVRIEEYLEKASRALDQRNATFFAEHLSSKDYWRLYKDFADKTLYLDVETTGLSLHYDRITLIGTFNGEGVQYFIRDNNLDEFSEYLANYEVVVTFNGKLFDIPFIQKQYVGIRVPPVHIDLRYLLRSIGVIGSLKRIECSLGLSRPSELQSINGREAVVLWTKFLKGDDHALEKLLVYNSYDTFNLQTLLDYCYRLKADEIRARMEAATYQLELGQRPVAVQEHVVAREPNRNCPEVQIKHVSNGLLDLYMNGRKQLSIRRDAVRRPEVKLTKIMRRIRRRGFRPSALGVDLTGSEERASGVCFLEGNKAYMHLLKRDAEIIELVEEVKPCIISIDSPLNLPHGRCCPSDDCDCRKYGIMRSCERTLKSRGINVYPCLIPSMQKLTMRGIRLSKLLRRKGYEVIESYPGAAQDILGLPRKRVDLRALEIDLLNMGIKPISRRQIITHDEIDALTSALVGYFYQAGQFEALGGSGEGDLIIPSVNNG